MPGTRQSPVQWRPDENRGRACGGWSCPAALAVPVLVGLGIEELSGSPSAIPVVKEIVHALDSGLAGRDARAALEAGTAHEVATIGADRLRERGLLEHPDIGPWLQTFVSKV